MKTIQAILGMLLLAAAFLLTGCVPAANGRGSNTREWTFIYYMSYDNDLADNAPIILDALAKGVKSGDCAVTVLADDADSSGLKRYAITAAGVRMDRLASDDSSSEQQLADYLEWARKNYPARQYAVVFLDHGGRLDEMCLDEHPAANAEPKWLSARKTGDVLREFRQQTAPEGAVELLFLQQCGRGTVENLYNFRGTAAAVMASQLGVGNPNTYYQPTLAWLAAHPEAGGRELARQIMTTDEHFNNYVCVDGKALAELPARLDPVLAALLAGGDAAPPRPPRRAIECRECNGERNYDLKSWLEAAFRENGRPPEELDIFLEWMRKKLIWEYAVQPRQQEALKELCGLALFVPESAEARMAYADYPFHTASRLAALWRAMPAPRGQTMK